MQNYEIPIDVAIDEEEDQPNSVQILSNKWPHKWEQPSAHKLKAIKTL